MVCQVLFVLLCFTTLVVMTCVAINFVIFLNDREELKLIERVKEELKTIDKR